jgi:outer membrane protein assembly factor BamB
MTCAADIRSAPIEVSAESRPGVALLQKRLERERRQHARRRGEDPAGGGGWIAAGAVVILIALVVGPDREMSAVAWIAALALALSGVWQIRRDPHAMRIWGGFLAGTAALVLMFVGFRAIEASGPFGSGDLPAGGGTPQAATSTPALVSPPDASTGSVPMAGGGATHDSVMPGPAPAESPVLAWQADTGGELYSAPTISNGLVYVMSKSGMLHAIESTTGVERWTYEVTTYVTRATPAVIDGTVYIGGGFSFIALDAATGEERWSIPLQYGGQASPTVQDGLVVVSSQQGWIFALDARSGETVWRLPTEGIVFGAAAMIGESVIYGTDEGILYSVDRRSGTLDWRVTLAGPMYATPVVIDGAILATTQAGEIHALALDTGDRLWSTNHGSALAPASNGDIVVLASNDGGVYGLDAATGAQRWLYPSGKESLTAPAISGDLAIVGTGTSLLALDLETGEAQWYFLAGDTIESAPVVVDGYVYFGGRDGFLNAVSDR